MYIEEKTVNGKKYYYLVKEIRFRRKKLKFRTYLAKGDLPKSKLKRMAGAKRAKLEQKISAFLVSKDYFYSIPKPDIAVKLEKARRSYADKLKRLYNKDDYYEWFITEFTYDTNAIEGSTLTERETGMILFDNVVPKDRSLREIYEAQNHKRAFDFILSYKKDINLDFVLKLNKFILANIRSEHAGKIRGLQVYVRGANFTPPPPNEVKVKLNKLIKWYQKNKKKYHPVVLASYFHTEFEEIHPFVDGNGRVGRLLLNFILTKNRFPPINIKNAEKRGYYEALDVAHKGDMRKFVDLVVRYLLA